MTFERSRPHPWHGLDVGPDPPRQVHAYIEITPFDLVKYEIDKETDTTYKVLPGEVSTVRLGEAYGREHAERVVEASIRDYETFSRQP